MFMSPRSGGLFMLGGTHAREAPERHTRTADYPFSAIHPSSLNLQAGRFAAAEEGYSIFRSAHLGGTRCRNHRQHGLAPRHRVIAFLAVNLLRASAGREAHFVRNALRLLSMDYRSFFATELVH